MNKEIEQNKVLRMARDAGGADITCNGRTSWVGTQSTEFLERFANLIRAEFAKEDLEVIENLRKETIARCEAGMIEAYQLGRAEATKEKVYQAIRNAETPATQLTLGQQKMIKEALK